MDVLFDSFLIVMLRPADVSLGTVRIFPPTRGSRWRSSAIGFAETLIWVFAVTIVVQNLDDPVRMIAYAAGFALGTLLGVTIERWLAIGTTLVQVVAPVESPSSAPDLRKAGNRAIVINGERRDGGVRIIVAAVPRRRLRNVIDIIENVNPVAFVTVEDITIAPTRRRPGARPSEDPAQRDPGDEGVCREEGPGDPARRHQQRLQVAGERSGAKHHGEAEEHRDLDDERRIGAPRRPGPHRRGEAPPSEPDHPDTAGDGERPLSQAGRQRRPPEAAPGAPGRTARHPAYPSE